MAPASSVPAGEGRGYLSRRMPAAERPALVSATPSLFPVLIGPNAQVSGDRRVRRASTTNAGPPRGQRMLRRMRSAPNTVTTATSVAKISSTVVCGTTVNAAPIASTGTARPR